jgi:hypothetical protein
MSNDAAENAKHDGRRVAAFNLPSIASASAVAFSAQLRASHPNAHFEADHDHNELSPEFNLSFQNGSCALPATGGSVRSIVNSPEVLSINGNSFASVARADLEVSSIRSETRSTTVSRVSMTDFRVGTFERFSVDQAESELILERGRDAEETQFRLTSRRLSGVRFGASAVRVRFAEIPPTFNELLMFLALTGDPHRVLFPDLTVPDGGLQALPRCLMEPPSLTAVESGALLKDVKKFKPIAEGLTIGDKLADDGDVERRLRLLTQAPYIRIHTLAQAPEIAGPGDVHPVGDHGLHVNSFGTVLFGEMIFTRSSRRFLLTRFAFGSHIAGDGGGGETKGNGY